MSTFRQAPRTGFWSIERVVTILTPLFAAGAGVVSSLAGKLVPGVSLNKADLTALFITGATIAGGAALKWLHGRQKFVSFAADADRVVARLQAVAGQPLVDVEHLLKTHEAAIIDAVGKTVGASASAEDIAKQIVQNMWPSGPAQAGGAPTPPTS